MQPVERGQLGVMWVHAIIFALVLLTLAAIAETALPTELPRGAVLVPVLVLLVYPTLFAPPRRFRALRYALEPEELHVAKGRWIQTETVVPLGRVQHIDVAQGPIERAFGVNRLILHTAGTMNSQVVLPGLARERAEAIRDEIRSRIRQGAA